jgi:transposase
MRALTSMARSPGVGIEAAGTLSRRVRPLWPLYARWFRFAQYPSGRGRLPEAPDIAEANRIFGELRVGSVHGCSCGHNFDQAAARPRLAGGVEAGDRRGVVCPGSSVSVVARRYDVNTNQVFSWRKLYRGRPPRVTEPSGPVLVPLIVTPDPDASASPASSVVDTIEIELAGGYRVRVGSGFDAQDLRRVLDVLERR